MMRTAVVSIFFATLCAGVGSAQTTYNERHSIRERQQNQQRRIDQGVRSGQITPRGAHRERRAPDAFSRQRASDGTGQAHACPSTESNLETHLRSQAQ